MQMVLHAAISAQQLALLSEEDEAAEVTRFIRYGMKSQMSGSRELEMSPYYRQP